jgi:hypothetical protein
MTNFYFISSEKLDFNNFKNIEKFIRAYPDFQIVNLNNENDLEILLKLIDIDEFKSKELNETKFVKYWDLSNFKLPEYNEDEFDKFYQKWLKKSGRENTMDEYGGLIFLQGLSSKWNNLKYRLIVKENENIN